MHTTPHKDKHTHAQTQPLLLASVCDLDSSFAMSKGGIDVKVKSQGVIPSSYYCPHCKKLLKNAVQTSEGDRLCHVCFEEIAR
jgi:protein-disulfide isomerase